jgi:hypothetical protein
MQDETGGQRFPRVYALFARILSTLALVVRMPHLSAAAACHLALGLRNGRFFNCCKCQQPHIMSATLCSVCVKLVLDEQVDTCPDLRMRDLVAASHQPASDSAKQGSDSALTVRAEGSDYHQTTTLVVC